MSSKPTISVIIPVYKKTEMVLKNLKHNMKYIERYEIIVIDDASQEGIKKKINARYPRVKVIVNDTNKGFAPTVNIGIEEAKSDYVMLLNSDVRLFKAFPKDLTRRFKNHDGLFGISFKQKEQDGKPVGKNVLYFKNGFPQHRKAHDNKKGINAWAEGGACILRKDFVHELGGFNNAYAPFYWEDIDLSYRAYSRGWYVLYDPSIYIEHHHESTISKFYSPHEVKKIAYRNQFIFTWANITEQSLWFQHVLRTPYMLLIQLVKGDIAFLKGFFSALILMSRISKARQRKSEHEMISDSEIFARFSKEEAQT